MRRNSAIRDNRDAFELGVSSSFPSNLHRTLALLPFLKYLPNEIPSYKRVSLTLSLSFSLRSLTQSGVFPDMGEERVSRQANHF